MATLEQALKYVLGIDNENNPLSERMSGGGRGQGSLTDESGMKTDELNERINGYNLQDIVNANNEALKEAARIDREFQQSSAKEAMLFEARQAEMNRHFQKTSAQAAMNFEADQARINREFQENMANTAYQRATEDLKKAGLNPMLAYSNGGAAVTSGATASGFTSSGSTASGRTASGSRANVDTSTAASLLVAMVNAASNESISTYNGLLKAGGLLGRILGGK